MRCEPWKRSINYLYIVDALVDHGYVVVDDALDQALVRDLYNEALTTSYEKTSIGRGHLKQQQTAIRNDETKWLTASSDAQTRFLSHMQKLQENINQHLYMGLFDYESHFAHYKVGSFYKKHLDALQGKTNRVLTTVLYLNDEWSKEDGGEIIVYDENQEIVENLSPQANRLVIFLSERFPHEVLPAKRDRYSIAGWFRVREN